jgi:hypothetical protein
MMLPHLVQDDAEVIENSGFWRCDERRRRKHSAKAKIWSLLVLTVMLVYTVQSRRSSLPNALILRHQDRSSSTSSSSSNGKIAYAGESSSSLLPDDTKPQSQHIPRTSNNKAKKDEATNSSPQESSVVANNNKSDQTISTRGDGQEVIATTNTTNNDIEEENHEQSMNDTGFATAFDSIEDGVRTEKPQEDSESIDTKNMNSQEIIVATNTTNNANIEEEGENQTHHEQQSMNNATDFDDSIGDVVRTDPQEDYDSIIHDTDSNIMNSPESIEEDADELQSLVASANQSIEMGEAILASSDEDDGNNEESDAGVEVVASPELESDDQQESESTIDSNSNSQEEEATEEDAVVPSLDVPTNETTELEKAFASSSSEQEDGGVESGDTAVVEVMMASPESERDDHLDLESAIDSSTTAGTTMYETVGNATGSQTEVTGSHPISEKWKRHSSNGLHLNDTSVMDGTDETDGVEEQVETTAAVQDVNRDRVETSSKDDGPEAPIYVEEPDRGTTMEKNDTGATDDVVSTTTEGEQGVPYEVPFQVFDSPMYHRVCAPIGVSSVVCMTIKYPWEVAFQDPAFSYPRPVEERFFELKELYKSTVTIIDGNVLEECKNESMDDDLDGQVKHCLDKTAESTVEPAAPHRVIVVFTRQRGNSAFLFGTGTGKALENILQFFDGQVVQVFGDSTGPGVTNCIKETFGDCIRSPVERKSASFYCGGKKTVPESDSERQLKWEDMDESYNIFLGMDDYYCPYIRNDGSHKLPTMNLVEWITSLGMVRNPGWTKPRGLSIVMSYAFAHMQTEDMILNRWNFTSEMQYKYPELIMSIQTDEGRKALAELGWDLKHIIVFDGLPQFFPTSTSAYFGPQNSVNNETEFVLNGGYPASGNIPAWSPGYGHNCRGPVPTMSEMTKLHRMSRESFESLGLDMRFYIRNWEFSNQFWWMTAGWNGKNGQLDCTHGHGAFYCFHKYLLQATIDDYFDNL